MEPSTNGQFSDPCMRNFEGDPSLTVPPINGTVPGGWSNHHPPCRRGQALSSTVETHGSNKFNQKVPFPSLLRHFRPTSFTCWVRSRSYALALPASHRFPPFSPASVRPSVCAYWVLGLVGGCFCLPEHCPLADPLCRRNIQWEAVSSQFPPSRSCLHCMLESSHRE